MDGRQERVNGRSNDIAIQQSKEAEKEANTFKRARGKLKHKKGMSDKKKSKGKDNITNSGTRKHKIYK